VSTWKKNYCISILLKLNAIFFHLIDNSIHICRLLLYSLFVLILVTMSLPEERPSFEESSPPIGRVQLGFAASFLFDKPIGPAALRHMDRQTVSSILLLLCLYICSTYYVRYVEYKYRSTRKLDLMDTSNPPQADVDREQRKHKYDFAAGFSKC
jgi:hypothetical protein